LTISTGGSFRLFTHVYEKFGIKITYTDTTDAQNVLKALTPRTKLVWLESPTNPTLKISDIEAIARYSQAAGALLVVDNTFCSPAIQTPLTLGADIVIHSATKYLAGHSDVIAGLLAVKDRELGDRLKFIQNASGGILGPWDSWLTIRGIETLPLRIEAHSRNALAVAQARAGARGRGRGLLSGTPLAQKPRCGCASATSFRRRGVLN
jgi:cystathionine beta-lyase